MIAKCLFELTKPNAKFNWTDDCDKAFRTLKNKLVTSPILAYPDVDGGEFILDTDASHMAIDAVLSQLQHGQEKVIAYGSRTLHKPEVNYCVTRKELLAVVYFVKYFKHYLLGRKFTLRTDHGSLTWLYKFKEPDGQISRWIQQLSAYDFTILHRPGKKHGNADAMSRVKIKNEDYCVQCKLPWNYSFVQMDSETKSTDLKTSDESEGADFVEAVNVSTAETQLVEKEPKRRGRKPNVPKRAKPREQPDMDLTPSLIHQMQSNDTDLGEILKLKMEKSEKPTYNEFTNKGPCYKNWMQNWELLDVRNNMLCYYWQDSENKRRWRICTPKALQAYVLWHLHDSPVGGHQGISRTCNLAKLCPFFWPKMNQNVRDHVRTCDICEEKKQPPRGKRHKMKSYIMGARFERLASDIAGPFPTTERGNTYILVIQDYFTKFLEVYPIADMEAETVADVLLKGWIKRYGCPVELHTDQGTQYESQLFKGVCNLLNISKTRTTPAHPRSDGMVERSNRTIKEMLAKYINKKQDDWDLYLDYMVMSYNATPHDSTNITPYRMVFGEEMRMPLDIVAGSLNKLDRDEDDDEIDYRNEHFYVAKIRQELETTHEIARENLQKSAIRQKEYYDRNVKDIKYCTGDLVRRWQPQTMKGTKRKLARNWTGPWVVVERLTDVLFKIKHSKNSPVVVIHADNLKPYYGKNSIDWCKPQKTTLDGELPNIEYFKNMEINKNRKSDNTYDKTPLNTDTEFSENKNTPQIEERHSLEEEPTDGDTYTYKKQEPPDGTVPRLSEPPPPAEQHTRFGRRIIKPKRFQ